MQYLQLVKLNESKLSFVWQMGILTSPKERVREQLWFVQFYYASFFRRKNRRSEPVSSPERTVRIGILFSSDGDPVFGSFGAMTVTVASETSVAVKPLALPRAVPVFVVVCVKLVRQV